VPLIDFLSNISCQNGLKTCYNCCPFHLLHRIVLERPEYGYATYFFEAVQSTPVEWQIRRLVVAMKLSGCGRTALIENRPLLVRLLASMEFIFKILITIKCQLTYLVVIVWCNWAYYDLTRETGITW